MARNPEIMGDVDPTVAGPSGKLAEAELFPSRESFSGRPDAGDPSGLELKSDRPEELLVINCGSSSLKYQFYNTTDESRQAAGQVERIGMERTRLVHRGSRASGNEVKRELPKGEFAQAFAAMI